ncbi:MAG: imidazole glycerol phosphate synthase subunit HisH [Clostridia bacterium]|nr:imidazole glycerol phosphate synthase subunit HisH [Clostridia bacterium]
MIAIIDYGAGNLRNVAKAFDYLGIENIVTDDIPTIEKADKIVLPGVGAFGEGMANLAKKGLDKVLINAAKKGTPLLGICLGMQMLFDESEESPGVCGLGILKGRIVKLPKCGDLKIPHMGWNDITCRGKLFEGLDKPFVYFVHSYYLDAEDKSVVSATVHYGIDIEVAVESNNVYATQFHPEKSSDAGLRMLSNFAKL